ncbi:MAG: thioredoxin [Thermoguttaceae bacterium]
MSELVLEVKTEAEFQQQIESGVVLVDFFATWCGPCRMQVPVLHSLAAKLGNTAKIIKVDTDALSSVAKTYDISSIPTLILFKNGQMVNRFVGLQQETALENAIKSA